MFGQINSFPQVKNVQEETDSDDYQRIDSPDHHVLVSVIEDEDGWCNGEHETDNKNWGEHDVSVKGMEELVDVFLLYLQEFIFIRLLFCAERTNLVY